MKHAQLGRCIAERRCRYAVRIAARLRQLADKLESGDADLMDATITSTRVTRVRLSETQIKVRVLE